MRAIPYVVKEFVIDQREGQNFVTLPESGKVLTADLVDNQLVLYVSVPECMLPPKPAASPVMCPFLVLPTDAPFEGWLNSTVEWHYVTTFRIKGKTLHLFFEGIKVQR